MKNRKAPFTFILFFAALFLLPQKAFAQKRIIYVPQDYPSIQQAIDNANQGDIIQLSEGLYSMPEDVEGWVIKNGASHDIGAIALIPNLTLRGNVKDPSKIIIQREAFANGPHDGRPYYHYRYTIEADYADGATVEGVTIKGFDGIRVAAWDQPDNSASITIRNCILEFIGNVAIYNHSLSRSNIINNTFIGAGNVGIEAWGLARPVIKNNILLQCHIAIAKNENSDLTSTYYNDIFNCDYNYYGMDDLTGINGNIAQDPQFIDEGAGEEGVDMGAYGLINPKKAYQFIYQKMDRFHTGATLRLIESFAVPFPPTLTYTAWVYDNALVICALIARGQPEDIQRARILCESLIWVQGHDQDFNDGRIRDGYWANSLSTNGVASIKEPGSGCGNVAWAALALLNYYKYSDDPDTDFLNRALRSAESMGNFIETQLRDSVNPGYFGGFQGWGHNPPKHRWKNTEHNVAVYAVFSHLYEATADDAWLNRAIHAKRLVTEHLWNARDGYFYVGTTNNGITPNTTYNQQSLDPQTFSTLSLGEAGTYHAAMDWAFQNCGAVDAGFIGFDFNRDRDGVWFEGTAQASLAYLSINKPERHTAYLSQLRLAQTQAQNAQNAQEAKGKSIVAASRDMLTTGFDNFYYFSSPHIGATAWYLLAENEYNPFWGIYLSISPKQPTIDAITTPTNQQTQLLTGTKQANASIWLNGAEVVPIDSSTTWSYTVNLQEGTNYIYIKSKDANGNESMPLASKIVLDTTALKMNIILPKNRWALLKKKWGLGLKRTGLKDKK